MELQTLKNSDDIYTDYLVIIYMVLHTIEVWLTREKVRNISSYLTIWTGASSKNYFAY